MFKWLKKVMISIINAIKSLFVGDKEVQSVSIGNTEVYSASTTYVIRSISLSYSSGSKLNAAGSNYAQVMGEISAYKGGSLVNTFTTALTPILPNNPQFLSISEGTKIVAPNRGTSTGSERSEWVTGSFTSGGTTYTIDTSVQVTQQANAIVSTEYIINNIVLFSSADGTNYSFTPSGSNLLEINDSAKSLGYTVSGYAKKTFTSGVYTNDYSGIQWTVDAVVTNNQYCSWITPTSSGNAIGTIDFSSFSGDPGDTREATLRVYYYSPTNSSAMTITVRQTVSNYVFTGLSSSNVANYQETFTVTYTATNDGQPLTTEELNSITWHTTSNGIGCNYVSRKVSGTSVIFTFSCHQNTTTNSKTTVFVANFAGKTVTTSVTQAAGYNVSYVNIARLNAGNQAIKLVVGTVSRSSGESLGIVLASPDPITSNINVMIQLKWSYSGGGPYDGTGSTPVSMTINAGDWVNIGSSSLYGKWYTEPRLSNASIDMSYTNVEIETVGAFVAS